MTNPVPRTTYVPADVRLANLVRIVHELREAGALSRSEVARRVGVSLPTAHRLVSDLAGLDLVGEESVPADGTRLGRPPVVYRFRDDAAVLVGMDVGNETTRIAVTALSGRVIASQAMTTESIGTDLAGALAGKVTELLASTPGPVRELAGAGAGIASAVDGGGILRDPPLHKQWNGLPLRDLLADRLGCDVLVAQDDHLSPIAESSDQGTVPGAASVLVLEIGRGIGVGLTIDGVPVPGSRHRFGRIAGWPVLSLAGQPGTLGEFLVTSGLVAQYREAGGSREVTDGAGLASVARRGDERAREVFGWAGEQIGDVVTRLFQLCDPEAVVIGGGMARAYDLLEPAMARGLPLDADLKVARSVLGEQAVVTGAVLTAGTFVEGWLHRQLARA